jgi:general stress protein YciG
MKGASMQACLLLSDAMPWSSIRNDAVAGRRGATRRREPMTTQIGLEERSKSLRGFASMELSKQREIASKGGKAAHARGRAHEFTAEEAREAGRKGGAVVSLDRDHMAAIGRAGGLARGRQHGLPVP